MTANADRNVCIHNAKPFEDETDGKEHSESQNEQHVLGSNQNDRPVNLSAQLVHAKPVVWFMLSIYLVSRFTRLFESTINIMVRAKRKAGRTTKKLLTLTLTCTPCFSWRQVRRLRIIHFGSYLRVVRTRM